MQLLAKRSRLVRFLAVACIAGCTGTLNDQAIPFTGPRANIQDYLYLAIQNIAAMCPDLGNDLMDKYYDGSLTWGDVVADWDDIGYTDPDDNVEMDYDYYHDPDYTDEELVEYLTADVFHEAGHAIGHLSDDPDPQYDSFGRLLNHNPYDADYASGDCPY